MISLLPFLDMRVKIRNWQSLSSAFHTKICKTIKINASRYCFDDNNVRNKMFPKNGNRLNSAQSIFFMLQIYTKPKLYLVENNKIVDIVVFPNPVLTEYGFQIQFKT